MPAALLHARHGKDGAAARPDQGAHVDDAVLLGPLEVLAVDQQHREVALVLHHDVGNVSATDVADLDHAELGRLRGQEVVLGGSGREERHERQTGFVARRSRNHLRQQVANQRYLFINVDRIFSLVLRFFCATTFANRRAELLADSMSPSDISSMSASSSGDVGTPFSFA